MPLSKAKQAERMRQYRQRVRYNVLPSDNDIVVHLYPALLDWLKERAGSLTADEYIVKQLEKAVERDARLHVIPKTTIDPMRWQA